MTKQQNIINKINAKQDFTINLTDQSKRYIVGVKNLFTGSNPSTQYETIYKDIMNPETKFDSVGGWLDTDSMIYFVDYSMQLDNLSDALQLAKENGLFVGISAGANVLASEQWIKQNNPNGIVVTILCDRGERYFSVL